MTSYFRSATTRGDALFASVSAIIVIAIVVLGFARTFYFASWFGSPALPWLLYLHGVLMSSWLALFLVQAALVRAGRMDWHRRLGVAGAVVAANIVLVASTVAIRAGARDMLNPPPDTPPPLEFMGFVLYSLLVYVTLVAAALLFRRRRDYHMRLLLLSCFALLGPAVFRIPLADIPALAVLENGGPTGVLGLDLIPLYGAVAYDTWRHRRLHPAFLVGGFLLISEDLPLTTWFFSGDTWNHLALWLTNHSL